MDRHSDFRSDWTDDGGPLQAVKSTLAYSILMLGLAGTIAAVPALVWALVNYGLH